MDNKLDTDTIIITGKEAGERLKALIETLIAESEKSYKTLCDLDEGAMKNADPITYRQLDIDLGLKR